MSAKMLSSQRAILPEASGTHNNALVHYLGFAPAILYQLHLCLPLSKACHDGPFYLGRLGDDDVDVG